MNGNDGFPPWYVRVIRAAAAFVRKSQTYAC